jgi:hypothetical protein
MIIGAMESRASLTHPGPCRWARISFEFRPSSDAHKRIGVVPRRAYKHGVCPCEVAKVESGSGDRRCSPGPLLFT